MRTRQTPKSNDLWSASVSRNRPGGSKTTARFWDRTCQPRSMITRGGTLYRDDRVQGARLESRDGETGGYSPDGFEGKRTRARESISTPSTGWPWSNPLVDRSIEVTRWRELVELEDSFGPTWMFRGHSDDWPLKSSLHRLCEHQCPIPLLGVMKMRWCSRTRSSRLQAPLCRTRRREGEFGVDLLPCQDATLRRADAPSRLDIFLLLLRSTSLLRVRLLARNASSGRSITNGSDARPTRAAFLAGS